MQAVCFFQEFNIVGFVCEIWIMSYIGFSREFSFQSAVDKFMHLGFLEAGDFLKVEEDNFFIMFSEFTIFKFVYSGLDKVVFCLNSFYFQNYFFRGFQKLFNFGNII
ncbi:MAG: hypothetical protein ABIJ36_01395 [Patescibacteria group bacterium]